LKIAGFISYYHADGKELADCLAKYLKNLFPNFEPVYDQDVAEGNKIEEIKKKLALCNILIVIITPGALASQPVAEEIEEAKRRKMKIIPCKDKYLNKDWAELPWDLSDYKGIDFENAGEQKRKTYSALMKVLEELSKEFEDSLPKKTPTEESKLTDEDSQTLGPSLDPKKWHKFSLKTRKQDHNILATMLNGNIEDILLNRKAISLIYKITAYDDGYLKTIIRRELLDAKTINEDEKFFVLIDGEDTDYDEMPSSIKQRALQIKIPKNAKEVEIIGTEREGVSYLGKVKEGNEVRILRGTSVPSADKFLDPETLTIKANEKVLWINDDTAAHTITSGTRSGGPDGIFDSSLFMAGTTFEITFHRRGTYKYFDMVHPWIKGEIIVK